MMFIIGVDGLAETASIRAVSYNHPDFVEFAGNTVRSCRYIPARHGGRPVRTLVFQPINFITRP